MKWIDEKDSQTIVGLESEKKIWKETETKVGQDTKAKEGEEKIYKVREIDGDKGGEAW
jgi:hypothetical protein